MRVWLQCFTIGLLFMISPPTFGQDVRSHRVLFLGNSVFYYGGGLYQSFEGFCKADGLDYQAVSQLLQPDNPHGIEFLDFGRIPLNLPEFAANDQIHSLIRSNRFDYVILEARRPGYLIPAWVERPAELPLGQFIAYERNLTALGKIHRTIVESGAQTVLYMHPGLHTLPDLKHPVAQIYERLRADLENMEINGERHNVTLVPASLLWLDALNRYKLEDWYADRAHGTALARYASGCMLFTYLTGKDPRKNNFRELPRFWQTSSQEPSDYVSEEDAKWIKDQVWFYYSTRPHALHGEEGEESGLTMYAASGASQIGWQASGKDGAVAAGGKEAVAAGISILEQGGNAADAAAATLLALSITDYGSYAIGAEIPLIIYDARKKEVKVLCGLGGAPLDRNAIEWYYKNGIPGSGGMKAAPVPGALSLCITTVKLYGTMTFEQVVAPSLELLDSGPERGPQDWHENLAITFHKLIQTEKRTPGSRQKKLQAARDRFYKGDIAEELVAFYVRNGGFLRKADLAAHVTRVEDPVKVQYRGYTVCKCDTWTQGPYLCQTLRLLEGFDLKKMGHLSADYIHVLTEALKLGFADRDEYYGDPLFVDVPIEALLSDEYTELRRSLIDMTKASTEIRPGDPVNMKAVKGYRTYQPGPGGTTTCVVADRWGNLVAATPSGNGPYAVCHELGVAHGNRLRSLNTTPGHPNRIEPGKRPRITLTPTIVLKDGKAVIAISVAGGDLQDQTTLNCLLNHLEFGMMPEDAVTAPRFSTGHQQNSFDPNPNREKTLGTLASLTLDESVDENVRRKLANRGHKVIIASRPIAHPVMIYVDPNTGMIYAAGDPKARRHAAALENTWP